MSREACVGYLKTLSGYNFYKSQNPDAEDPIKRLEEELTEEVICENDVFWIVCHKKSPVKS